MQNAVVQGAERGVKQVNAEVLVETVRELEASFGDKEFGAALPTYDSATASLYRARAKIIPSLPQSRAEIVLEGQFTKTLSDKDLPLIDDGTENEILGFSTEDLIEIVCDEPTLFMDGAFRVLPRLFLQLHTIHANYRGQMFPLAFSLLPDKTKIKGCNLYFGQCLSLKFQNLGPVQFYGDSEVKQLFRSYGALSLVPVDRIDEALADIEVESPSAEHSASTQIEAFKEYFRRTRLENESVFPRVRWNHYGNFGARTTNHVEGWPSALAKMIRKGHVNFSEMIKFLKKEEAKLNFCPFCRKNGEPPEVFESHRLKDPNDITTCPKLRAYRCRICHNGGGDFAHTMRYCPKLVLGPRRRQRREIELIPVSALNYCPFCRKNGESPQVFKSHRLKDRNDIITCPQLRAYSCGICHNGGGDFAHTMSYCPTLARPKLPRDFHQKRIQ
ncbi:uncharacterized protein LOC108864932 [Galendromus occidentalis]|uniref:Uncharacterized protein LOC108864932 n=1 Tax=Galendromus occidentalis TaxID=34638 RepID=A0AAJ7L640_9ACAR|nr:uncharacterized protein LOC108864932 [Galendromus occidentalis]